MNDNEPPRLHGRFPLAFWVFASAAVVIVAIYVWAQAGRWREPAGVIANQATPALASPTL